MSLQRPLSLSRRERQIMDVLHRRGRATAAEITADLEDAPTNTTIRTLLRILSEKGHVRFEQDGRTYVYSPAADRDETGASMLHHVVRTFFGGSPDKAMAALLGADGATLTDAQIDRIERLIAEARRSGR